MRSWDKKKTFLCDILLDRKKNKGDVKREAQTHIKSLNKHEETINQNVNNENVEKCCVCLYV